MNDMRPTIIAKSDQLNADDLIGRTLTIRITKVEVRMDEQPVSISYEGDNGKPYKPGKSMRRVLVNVWGPDAGVYTGRALTLYRDDKVKFGGLDVGGIRISHMSNLPREMTMALTVTRAQRKPFTVRPLIETAAPAKTAEPPAEQRYPTLFGIKDGAQWMANFQAALDAAQTEGEVADIGGLQPVVWAIKNWKGPAQARVKELLADAMARVTSATDEPIEFGDDDAPDDTAEAAQ